MAPEVATKRSVEEKSGRKKSGEERRGVERSGEEKRRPSQERKHFLLDMFTHASRRGERKSSATQLNASRRADQ